MKQQKVILIILLVLFLMVIGFITMGWRIYNKQNNELETLKDDQAYNEKGLSQLKDSFKQLNSDLQVNMKDLQNIEQALKESKLTSADIALKLDGLSKKLERWEVIYDEMATRMDELNNRMMLSEEQIIKKIELGEVSIEKETPSDVYSYEQLSDTEEELYDIHF